MFKKENGASLHELKKIGYWYNYSNTSIADFKARSILKTISHIDKMFNLTKI